MLTKEEIAKALPANLKTAATQSLTDMVNNVTTDPDFAKMVRDNFVSYTSVLKDGKFKTEDYLHAVTYVSYKLMGMGNQEAYCRTFPQRHARLVAEGVSTKDIAAYVSAYSRGKLVNLIMEQSLVPTWVLNQDLHQKALNVQADLMLNAVSEKVRSDAANSILTHLAKPKEVGPLVSIDMRNSDGMNELRATLGLLAQQQQDLINSGVSTKVVAAQNIVDVEAKQVP